MTAGKILTNVNGGHRIIFSARINLLQAINHKNVVNATKNHLQTRRLKESAFLNVVGRHKIIIIRRVDNYGIIPFPHQISYLIANVKPSPCITGITTTVLRSLLLKIVCMMDIVLGAHQLMRNVLSKS